MNEKFDRYAAIGAAFLNAGGYRVVREIGRNVYLVHVPSGRRSCIGRRDRDEQWLMGGDWTAPEQIQPGSANRN